MTLTCEHRLMAHDEEPTGSEFKAIEDQANRLFEMREGAQNDLKRLYEYVGGLPTDTIWFLNLITHILRSLSREYNNLNVGYSKDGRLLAWACRNLLEISICTEWALKSSINARAIADDQIIDVLEILESFKEWLAAGDSCGTTPVLDQTIKMMKEAKAQAGVTSAKYIRTEDMARSLNRRDEYRHLSKVSSKLVHPTAYSLFGVNGESELLMKPYLYRAGTFNFASAFKAIRNHIEQFGSVPPCP